MKCPYCNKSVKDIVNHLEKSEKCAEKHKQKLIDQTKVILGDKK